MNYLKPKGLPDVLAKQAYEDGYYIEAIQILHSFLENQARSFLMLIGCVRFNAEQKATWDISDSIKFHDVLKVLFILNQITEEEYKLFNHLNSLRNKVVHQFYKEPYKTLYLGVPKKEFDEVFSEIQKQTYFFTEKTEALVNDIEA